MKKEENTIELKILDQENTKILSIENNNLEENTIVFNIGNEEKIKVNNEGFFVEGRLVKTLIDNHQFFAMDPFPCFHQQKRNRIFFGK